MAHIEDLWTRKGPEDERVRTARYGSGNRWRARWIEPNGTERSKTFRTKGDAELYLDRTMVNVADGMYVAPNAGAITVGAWADLWLATKSHRKATTRAGYESIVRTKIKPKWGDTSLNRVQHQDVQEWVSKMAKTQSASRTRQAAGVLSQVLAYAVRARKIAFNPVTGIDLPTIPQSGRTYLTHEQVGLAAQACGEYELLVYVMAYTGIREGEAFNMRAAWVDPLKRRISVRRSASWVGGVRVEDTTKSHRWREVPIPAFLADRLGAAVEGLGLEDLVFTDSAGGPLRPQNFLRRVWYPALASAGLPRITLHELRHTGASLAIGGGADVKVVQAMLGHADASTTLNVYAHLMDDRLDEVAEALDRARALSLTAQRRHGGIGNVVPFRRPEPKNL